MFQGKPIAYIREDIIANVGDFKKNDLPTECKSNLCVYERIDFKALTEYRLVEKNGMFCTKRRSK